MAEVDEILRKGMRAARAGQNETAQGWLRQAVEAAPDNEMAWLWLARVQEDPAERARSLRRVLELNPENKWAAKQLQAEQPAPVADVQKEMPEQQFGELKVELLRCPNCAGQVSVHGDRVRTVVCQHCDSVVDLTPGQAQVLEQKKRRLRPAQPIELGAEGTFGGVRHMVIGWLRYKGWDDEDTWYWDEWLLAGADGTYRWLSYDDEVGFTLYRPLPVMAGFNPDSASTVPVPGGQARIVERAPAKITALDGELTWRARTGDRLKYIDAVHQGRKYSVEYTADEIELLEGLSLSEQEVWQAFGREDMLQKVKARAENERLRVALAAVFFLFALLGGCGVLGALTSGRVTQEETVTLDDGRRVAVLGPISLDAAGRPHEVELRVASLPVNSWAVVAVTAVDEAGNEFYLFAEEFWDEEGRDSEGYWHETDYEGSYNFRPEVAGDYTFEVELDEKATNVGSVDVRLRLKSGVWMARYFIVFGVLCAIAAYVLFESRS